MDGLDLRQLLEMLFKRKEPAPYASVLEQGDMASPHYRKYLERQQGLEGVYPELIGLTRGRGIPEGSVAPAVSIGSKVPKGYIPFGELSNIDRGLAMLKAQRSRPSNSKYLKDGLKDSVAEWDTRLAPEMALMAGKFTSDQFEEDRLRKLRRVKPYGEPTIEDLFRQ